MINEHLQRIWVEIRTRDTEQGSLTEEGGLISTVDLLVLTGLVQLLLI